MSSSHLVASANPKSPNDASLNVRHPLLTQCVRVSLYHTRSPRRHDFKAEPSVQVVRILDRTHSHVLSNDGVILVFSLRLVHHFVALESEPSSRPGLEDTVSTGLLKQVTTVLNGSAWEEVRS